MCELGDNVMVVVKDEFTADIKAGAINMEPKEAVNLTTVC